MTNEEIEELQEMKRFIIPSHSLSSQPTKNDDNKDNDGFVSTTTRKSRKSNNNAASNKKKQISANTSGLLSNRFACLLQSSDEDSSDEDSSDEDSSDEDSS